MPVTERRFTDAADFVRRHPDLARSLPVGEEGTSLSGVELLPRYPQIAEYLSPQERQALPLLLAAALSLLLGLFAFMLSDTPPAAYASGEIPFLKTLRMIWEPHAAIFLGTSFLITLALAFYYSFTALYLEQAVHVKPENIGPLMTVGQCVEILFMLTLPWFLTTLGMKVVLIVGMAAWAVRYALFALRPTAPLDIFGIALHGICFDFFFAAGMIHTEAIAAPDIRASAQSLFGVLTYGLGMGLGTEASGWLNQFFTRETSDARTGEKVPVTDLAGFLAGRLRGRGLFLDDLPRVFPMSLRSTRCTRRRGVGRAAPAADRPSYRTERGPCREVLRQRTMAEEPSSFRRRLTMALLDHVRPPFAQARQWRSFHSAWATTITQQLNEVLPEDYFAEPHVQWGNQFEVDVATLHENGKTAPGGAAVATALWAPPRPTQTIPVSFANWESVEVNVYQNLGGPQLKAAVELVSPANKDRPSHRQAFAVKCGSYLQRGVSVVVVDIVTERLANLHAEILQALELTGESAWQSPSNLYTVAYRTVLSSGTHDLEIWTEPLALGEKLPVMPLWLDVHLCLPLRLEESYVATCQSLRIRL